MSKQIDDNGYWLIEGNPISKEGVFPYLGKTISPRLEPNKLYQVYRPFAELSNPETLKSFDGIPFIEDHEMLGEGFTSTDKRTPQGVLMNTRAENGMIVGDLKIFSDSLKARIESGKKELSLGYRCHYDLTPGEWNGQKYDAVQTKLRGNHIALVNRGRMGSDVRVFDSFACDALEIATTNITKESSDMDNPEKKENEVPETPAKDEAVDKRKLIDEIGGILKDKVDSELIRTIIGKCEKIAYNGSEASKADDEAEEKAEKKDEEKSEDACGKDEDKPEEKAAEEKKSEDEDEPEKKDEEKKSEDACGKDKACKDEFYDAPKMEKTVRQLVSTGTISEEVAKKILGSEKYVRGGMDEADYIGAYDRRNALYAKVSKIVGDFAMDGMTEQDVAKFAAEKLGIAATVDACEAYCAAWEKSYRCVEVAADSAPNKAPRRGAYPADIQDYLNKK